MHGIRLAQQMLAEGRLPKIDLMTNDTERFGPEDLLKAIDRAADSDSLKVIVEWA
jgi:L-iditol 2-dehydrogenase